MKERTREEPVILAAAERRMHTWAFDNELKDRADRHDAEGRTGPRAIRFVAISREAGAGGSDVGQRVGERLGWEVFDRKLLDFVADRFHLPRSMLDLVDETHSSWVYDVLGTWMDRKLVPHEKYVACLSRVVLTAARRGPAVFVGRGARLLLPRKETLAVRVIASLKFRVQNVMQKRGMKEAEARHWIQEIDEGRREFVERFFHHDITDPHQYDLVINVERCGVERAVDEIVAAVSGSASPVRYTSRQMG
jgi:cytidylate kinase